MAAKQPISYDAIIVGGGQAGPPLAVDLANKGLKVALCEGNLLGGSCVNYGCTPSKTLHASAKAIHMARQGDTYGFHVGEVTVDFARVMERQRKVVNDKRAGLEQWVEGTKNLTLYHAWAEFESSYVLRVGDDLITSERIYLNVGGRALIPNIPGLSGTFYLDNQSILHLNTLPEHLIILGAGVISLEYGQNFARFGSRVSVLEKGKQAAGREDEDVAKTAQEILEKDGVQFHLDTAVNEVTPNDDGTVTVAYTTGGKQGSITGTHLLVATGRTPNSDKLATDKAGLALDARGYFTVDDHLLTNVPGIYALGEANGKGPFTHTAYNDYEIAIDNFNGGSRKISDRVMTYAMYTDPPLGRAGMTEREAREKMGKVRVGNFEMSRVGRAIEEGRTDGFMKIVVGEDDQILGAAIFGIRGDEVVQGVVNLMALRAPYTQIQKTMYVHPTVTELLPSVLGNLE